MTLRTAAAITTGMIGTTTVEQTVKLGKLSSAPKQLLVNYDFDLLAE
jgi:hypothetical protein